MTEKTSWSLRRVGWTEPNFILHEHNKVISLGRACDVQKQCLGRHVSRRHCEFRQIKLEGKTYWTIKHLGGVSKTFLNRNAIPNNEEIQLNDRNLIGVGKDISRQEAKGEKRTFLYEVKAPKDWAQGGADNDHVAADDDTEEEAASSDDTSVSASSSPKPQQRKDGPPVRQSTGKDSNLPDLVKTTSSSGGGGGRSSRDSSPQPRPSTSSSSAPARNSSSTKRKSDHQRDDKTAKRIKIASPEKSSSRNSPKLLDSDDDDNEEERSRRRKKEKSARAQDKPSIRKQQRGRKRREPELSLVDSSDSEADPAFAPKWTSTRLLSDSLAHLECRVMLERMGEPEGATWAELSAEGKVIRWHKDAMGRERGGREGSRGGEVLLSDLSDASSSSLISSEDSDSSEGRARKRKGASMKKRRRIRRAFSSSSSSSNEGGPSRANFSQVEEVILVDDSDGEYFASSQAAAIKKEPVDYEEEAATKAAGGSSSSSNDVFNEAGIHDDDWGDTGDIMLSLLEKRRPRDDDEKSVVDMDDDELEDFASSQGGLAEKICKVIKREREEESANAASPPPPPKQQEKKVKDDGHDNDERDEGDSQSLIPFADADIIDWRGLISSEEDDTDGGVDGSEPKREKTLQETTKSIAQPNLKKPVLIEALPQPSRKSYARGISAESVVALQGKQQQQQETAAAALSPRVQSPDSLLRTPPPAPKEVRRRPLTKEDVKEERTKRLKELAERERKKTQDMSRFRSPASRIKQSVPKTQKLTECDIFKPIRKKELEGASVMAAKKALRQRAQMVQRKSVDAEPPTAAKPPAATDEPEEGSSAVQKKPRTEAETKLDGDGHRVIAKMKFSNVISNVGSQAAPVATASSGSVPSATHSKESATEAAAKRKPRKSVRWRDQVHPGMLVVDIREIELVGKGRPVSNQRIFDAFDALKSQLPGNAPPNSAVASAPPGHQPPPPRSRHPTIDYRAVLERILNWPPTWLPEQANSKQAPPVEGDRMKCSHVTPAFHTYSDYCSTFYPLMLYELWECVYRDYSEGSRHQNGPRDLIACITTIKAIANTNLVNMQMLAFITDAERRHLQLSDGWLCKLDLRYSQRDNRDQLKPCFGLLSRLNVRRRPPDSDVHYAVRLEEASIKERRGRLHHAVELQFTVKRPSAANGDLNVEKPLIVQGVSRIKPTLRLFQAVEQVRELPLFRCVLNPRHDKFYVGNATDAIMPQIAHLPELRNLNEAQTRVVKNVARMCTTNLGEPQLALIQGPPGTGKTSTVVAAVLQLFSRWKHLKSDLGGKSLRVLVAAPSNAAVDEIARRLIRARAAFPEPAALRMVRVGRDSAIHPEVLPIQVEKLAEREVELREYRETNRHSVEMEVKTRQQAVNRLGEELIRACKEGDRDAEALVQRKIKDETVLLNRAKCSLGELLTERQRAVMRATAIGDLFRHSEVVFATLNSSMNGQMEAHAADMRMNSATMQRAFDVAVVDEASQCVEPESLVPMPLGFTKLVLVGDPEQLPATVLSQKAKLLSYNFSMFGRLFRYFDPLPGSPVQMLQVQYRMHPEISRWPNSYFYGGRLSDGPQERSLPFLRPYLLLDGCQLARETRKGIQVWNQDEALFVAQMARTITEKLDREGEGGNTVAVITFYARQRAAIESALGAMNLAGRVPVRTVDAFQGSESDIVIISCVRTSSSNIGFIADSERLNVALTRAKFALYVVGTFHALQRNVMWGAMISDAKSRHRYRRVRGTSDADVRRLIFSDSRQQQHDGQRHRRESGNDQRNRIY